MTELAGLTKSKSGGISCLSQTNGFEGARRLSAATRALAERYLSGEIGRAIKPADFSIPQEFYLSAPTLNQQYAEAVRLIAANAPLRILRDEKIVGAATLCEAMRHSVPLLAQSYAARTVPCGDWIGKQPLASAPALLSSVSHTTLDFEKALKVGYKGIRSEIIERMDRGGFDADGEDLLRSMLACIDAAGVWQQRYVKEIERLAIGAADAVRRNYEEVLATLRNVPVNPPTSFREAVQALWMLWDFQRLCGNWSGIGRVDKMLGHISGGIWRKG